MRVLYSIIAVIGAVLCFQYCSLQAETSLKTRVVIDNIGIPWEILWGPDNQIWMTERQGQVSRLDPETGAATVLAVIPAVQQTGEGGLLGMALHPAFPTSPYVFLAYTYNSNGATQVRIARYTYQNNTLVEPFTLVENIKGGIIHDGCRLLFAPDTTLLITTGDAADQSLPQRHDRLNGKILRVNTDGTIPADNPWPGSMLYSTGHRNAQGITWGPHGQLYSSEHGPANDDEVNLILPGYNYGWPKVHGYCDKPEEQEFCRDSTVVEPMIAWTPTLAVCGMEYYNHPAIPEWRNSLLLATLKASTLVQLQLSEDGTRITREREYFIGTFGRLRDVCVAPDGRVFISTSNSGSNSVIEIKASVPDRGWIQPSMDTLDMGSIVGAETAIVAQLVLTNVGSTTAMLTSVALAGGNASEFVLHSLPTLPLALAPYASIKLTVQFQPASAGEKSTKIQITGDTEEPLVIVVKAARKTQLDVFTPLSIEFGQHSIGKVYDNTVHEMISNVGIEGLVVKRMTVAPPFFIMNPKGFPLTLQPNQTIAATLRFLPKREGSFSRRLFIEFHDGIQREVLLSGNALGTTPVQEERVSSIELRVIPNPVTAGTAQIIIHSPMPGYARMFICNALGQMVVDRWQTMGIGQDVFVWNARDDLGNICPLGIYYVTVVTGKVSTTVPFLLL